MTYQYYLKIAEILFSIKSEFPTIPYSTRSAFQPFIEEGSRSNILAQVDIHLELDNFPKLEDPEKLFDSGEAWSMAYAAGEYQIITKSPQIKGELYWQARFDRECTQVTVHCGEELIIRDSDTIRITNPVQYPLDQLLTVYHLAQREGALIHAAGAVIGGRGIIFPGRSGAGKSTITRSVLETGIDFDFLSDDRIIVRKIGDTYTMFGTPWPGEARIAKNVSVSLNGIAFIHHGTKNEIKEIDAKDALQQLFPVTSIPWYDEAILPMLLDFCEGLVTTIPAYDLHFKPTIEIANFIEEYFRD